MMPMNSPDIRISVALVTRNRPESLNRCLESLRSQSVQPFEVVVSDDSEPEFELETEAIVKHWDCKYIPAPRRGLYANRNHAALACKGTHIRTMDDDHEFPEDHFLTIQKVVTSAPDSIWIVGEYWGKPTPLSTLHLPGEIQPRGFSKLPRNLKDGFAISDGASIYPKQVIENHRFLEVFKFGGLYLEFGARLKALGYSIQYIRETYVIHYYIPNQRSFNDEAMLQRSGFLAAYLTYSCYFYNLANKTECLMYFLSLALVNTLIQNKSSFKIIDFWQTLQLGKKYQNVFRSGNYKQII